MLHLQVAALALVQVTKPYPQPVNEEEGLEERCIGLELIYVDPARSALLRLSSSADRTVARSPRSVATVVAPPLLAYRSDRGWRCGC
jgi:hypothetical protein